MKINCLYTLSTVAGGLMLVSGCVIEPGGRVAMQLPVVEVAPAPVYVAPAPVYVAEDPAPVMVPDYYVWDGYENVGVVGGTYFYLGAGNVWLTCEPFRLERFHGWEGGHPDWRNHAIRNDHFRADSRGHVEPRRDRQEKAAPKKREDEHAH